MTTVVVARRQDVTVTPVSQRHAVIVIPDVNGRRRLLLLKLSVVKDGGGKRTMSVWKMTGRGRLVNQSIAKVRIGGGRHGRGGGRGRGRRGEAERGIWQMIWQYHKHANNQ